MASVEIDQESGFCFGVVTAIRKAEEQLAQGGTLYCLGDIVHNSDEVERLERKGLHTITHEEMAHLHNVKVLLRAHGEPPATYELARANNIEIIDATCPVVLQLQRRIKASYDNLVEGQQIVIYGKIGHAEVNGLVGQTDSKAIVIESESDLSKIDFSRDVYLYSQTTKSIEGFRHIVNCIGSCMQAPARLISMDTICRQVANRVGHLRDFARNHEVVLFVAGHKSSNGKVLYNECMSVNPNTHLVANESEVNPAWLSGAAQVGICGATSTPRWLMDKVASVVTEIQSVDNISRKIK